MSVTFFVLFIADRKPSFSSIPYCSRKMKRPAKAEEEESTYSSKLHQVGNLLSEFVFTMHMWVVRSI